MVFELEKKFNCFLEKHQIISIFYVFTCFQNMLICWWCGCRHGCWINLGFFMMEKNLIPVQFLHVSFHMRDLAFGVSFSKDNIIHNTLAFQDC